jgi:hypothetical protein
MATGTNGIATRENVNDYIASNAYGSSLKRCVTAASITSNAKVQIKSSALSRYFTNTNRLVRYSDIEPAPIIIRVSVDVSDSSYLYGSAYNPLTLMTGGRDITDPILPRAAAPTSLSSTSQNGEYSSLLEDSSVIDSSIFIPSDYSLNSLDTLDDVMKVADDFEKKEQENAIVRAPLLLLGMNLSKDGTAITLETSYTASANSSKIVYFTLKTINAPTSSNYGNYVLSYTGNLIKNKDGLYPTGSLRATDSSKGAQEETISIQSPGTYTFTTYFKLGKSDGGGGVTPTYKTWQFKLRLRVRDLAFYQIYTGLRNWVLYDSDGTVLTSGDKAYTYYTQRQFEQDLMNAWDEVVGEQVYIVSLGSYTESSTKGAPAYIDYSGFQCSMTANNLGALQYVSYRIENTMHTTYDRVSINTDNLNRCYFSVVVQGTNL